MIEELSQLIPKSMLTNSGAAFYAGRAAFASPAKLYVLGLNPGGSADDPSLETVKAHTRRILKDEPAAWSAYSDESWLGRAPGTTGLQPRVLHLFSCLNLDPRRVPSSNLIFLRSPRGAMLAGKRQLAANCWPFHDAVIRKLGVRVILCFGGTAGRLVADRVRATRIAGDFVEQNARRWRSVALSTEDGLTVVSATHPSIADWTATATDPSPLVKRVLAKT